MKTLNATPMSIGDQIVASLESNGHLIAQVTNRNFRSLDEVVGMIYGLAGRFGGIARLTIRNKTQGWCKVMSLATHRHMPAPALHPTAPRVSGRQYLIPF